jgi:hypothetical protein
VFFDRNGNGTRNHPVKEYLLRNAQITVYRSTTSEVVGWYTTTGTEEPYCFELEGGQSYWVVELNPADYPISTNSDTRLIKVLSGHDKRVEFGDRINTAPEQEFNLYLPIILKNWGGD